MEVRALTTPEERRAAMGLCWRVFLEFEAPDYSPEGVEAFRGYLENPEAISALTVYGALEEGRLLGTLAALEGQIALFFVEPEYHRKGIGRQLFQTILSEQGGRAIRVNAGPYAVGIYRRLGFFSIDEERVSEDGIRYTPMIFPGSGGPGRE